MKKTLRLLALAMVLVIIASALVSCAPSGKYSSKTVTVTTTWNFSGSKVVFSTESATGLLDTTITYKFKIDGDKIILTNTENDKETTHSFAQGDGYIKIDGITYNKE